MVLTVTARDDDTSNIEYKIEEAVPSGYFTIGGSNGQIVLNQPLDYRQNNKHRLTM